MQTDHERNTEILADLTAAFDAVPGPRVGDFIRTADGAYVRISFHRPAHACRDRAARVQTTRGGRFFLGVGYMEFSGSLDPAIPVSRLQPTAEVRDGTCWFFSRGHVRAHNGVDVTIPCRVYACPYTAAELERGVAA